MGEAVGKVLLELGWKIVPNWECLWKEAENGTHVEKLKNVDLDEPTSCLDHEYLGCTQRECKPNEDNIEKYKEMFESCISAGAIEKLPGWETQRENCSVVVRRGRTCSKMRGKVFRIGK